jgi:hypothetical protein
MNKVEFDIMEVRATVKGYYFVTMHQYRKSEPEHPDYIKDWLEFDGKNWRYEGYTGTCFVCFIEKKDEDIRND